MPLHLLLNRAAMYGELVAHRVGFFAGTGKPVVALGVTSPYSHWSETTDWTLGCWRSFFTQSSCQESAPRGVLMEEVTAILQVKIAKAHTKAQVPPSFLNLSCNVFWCHLGNV